MHSSVVVAAKFCQLAMNKAGGSGLSAMKLLRLVYIAHGMKLVHTGRPLISATVEAWNHGPIIPELHRRIRREYGDEGIVTGFNEVTESDLDSLSQEDLKIVQDVYKTYGGYSALELSKIVHGVSSPWHRISNSLENLDNVIIDDVDTRRYYSDLLARAHSKGTTGG